MTHPSCDSAHCKWRPQNRTFARTRPIHVCRIPDRPSKFAHVNFAQTSINRPPPQAGWRFSAAIRQDPTAKGSRQWRTCTFRPWTASGHSLGRCDRGAHEAEDGMDRATGFGGDWLLRMWLAVRNIECAHRRIFRRNATQPRATALQRVCFPCLRRSPQKG
jgi:hypothetical protein